MRKAYRQRQMEDVESLVDSGRRSWPESTISSSLVSATIDCSKAFAGVSKLFMRCLHNIQLHSFLSSVKEKVQKLSLRATIALMPGGLGLPMRSNSNTTPFSCKLPVGRLSFLEYSEAEVIFRAGHFSIRGVIEGEDAKPKAEQLLHDPHPSFLKADVTTACQVSELFKADLRNSWEQRYKLQAPPLVDVHRKRLEANLNVCKRKAGAIWSAIHVVTMPSEQDLRSRALEAAGLWRRVTPCVVLPLLVTHAGDEWRTVTVALGALAVIWTLEQQAERCLRFLSTKNEVALQKELANSGARNWKPIDHPEWLLLELEGDYRTRKVQVDVTNAMLQPKDNQNAVLQLNMGEGKTSMIVPALCASISDGHQFARLTVLSSLFRINFDALAFKLGGLLSRRVYTFPFSRDMKLACTPTNVSQMRAAYLECIAGCGVVVTRPEHRLSAQLMSLELCQAGGGELKNLLELVNRKVGDVLDESDLILQVKYQVVYTIGEQMNFDGGNLRWKLSQSVLHSARRHFRSLLNEFGSDAIEFKDTEEGASAFPHIRLLNDDLNTRLCELIAGDVLGGRDEDLAIRELKKYCDKIGITCTTRWYGFQYLNQLIMENHV